jgi:hypothetical protein
MSNGLDYLGCDELTPYNGAGALLGFDWMNLAKGAAGALSGTGDLLSSGDKKKGGGDDAVKLALEKQRLEDEKKKAESSATTMKIVLGVVGGLAAMTGIALVVRRK